MSGSSCERNQKRRNAFRLAPVLSRPSPSLTTPNPAVDVGPSAATMEQGPNRAKTTFGAPFFFFPPPDDTDQPGRTGCAEKEKTKREQNGLNHLTCYYYVTGFLHGFPAPLSSSSSCLVYKSVGLLHIYIWLSTTCCRVYIQVVLGHQRRQPSRLLFECRTSCAKPAGRQA